MWRQPRRPQQTSLIWTKSSATGSWCRSLVERFPRGRSPDWLKFKNPAAPAVNREAEEDCGR
jgi:hypothetical protein